MQIITTVKDTLSYPSTQIQSVMPPPPEVLPPLYTVNPVVGTTALYTDSPVMLSGSGGATDPAQFGNPQPVQPPPPVVEAPTFYEANKVMVISSAIVSAFFLLGLVKKF